MSADQTYCPMCGEKVETNMQVHFLKCKGSGGKRSRILTIVYTTILSLPFSFHLSQFAHGFSDGRAVTQTTRDENPVLLATVQPAELL